ncbi:MAG: GYD domain-containing protein [Longimicrobiales bacterium]
MAKYVTLYKFTHQGIRDIKSSPERVREATAAWEGMGGRLLGIYSTQGPYDLVAISEADDDEMAAAFALALGSQGNVTTLTMRAFDPEEYARIISKIP